MLRFRRPCNSSTIQRGMVQGLLQCSSDKMSKLDPLSVGEFSQGMTDDESELACISAPCFWSFTNHHKFNLLLAWPFAKRACPPCCRSYNLLGNQGLGATDAFKAWIRLGMIFGTSKVSCKLAAKLMKTDFVPKKCLVFKGCGLEATAETEWTNMTYISQKNNCDPQRQELCSGRYATTVLVLLGCCVCCRVCRVCTG